MATAFRQIEDIEAKTSVFYETLLQYWDREKLDSQKEIRILFLGQNGEVIKLWEFPKGSTINPNEAFEAATRDHASGIVIAQNDPDDKVFPDEKDKGLIDKFKLASTQFKVRLNDYILFSRWGYHSALSSNKI